MTQKVFPFEAICLVCSLLAFFLFVSFFVVTTLSFGEGFAFDDSLVWKISLLCLAILLLFSYISGLIAVILKLLKKPVEIWMVNIGWLIIMPLFYIVFFYILAIGALT